MKTILIIFFCSITFSCNSQNKEEQYKNIEHFQLNNIKDSILSKAEYTTTQYKREFDLHRINYPEKFPVQFNGEKMLFDYIVIWEKKITKEIVLIEFEGDIEAHNNKINIFLTNNFEKIDLDSKKRLKEFIEDPNVFFYSKNQLFKSDNIYIFMETINFKEKKKKNRINLYFYKYPFDKFLINQNLINGKIIEK
ncbi:MULTISPECIES: hypothetical protein [Flavobacterium]|uniref:Lipoprotein n=1 Tax=Flavobacterium columnare TaxID=996 RepID=A0AA94F3K1_9FLAO|nr:hypothetical protein [Flavobacterium columnare]MCH4831965.1 hypothetical protein [Flavobacterium columnare]